MPLLCIEVATTEVATTEVATTEAVSGVLW